MTYLIVKILLLLLLATVLGFLLGRWWIRRQFVDVSESYEGFRRSAEAADNAPWGDVLARFDGLEPMMRKTVKSELDAQPAIDIPIVDLSGISSKLNQVESRFADIPAPTPAVDLTATHTRLNELEEAIKAIPEPKTVDFSATNSRIDALEGAIKAIPTPELPEPIDLTPVNDRLNVLAASVKAFPQQIPQAKTIDLSELNSKMSSLSSMVSAIPVPATAEKVDFGPTNQRLGALETALQRIPGGPDLEPVENRLTAIEERLRLLLQAQKENTASAPQPFVAAVPVAAPAVTTSEPRLLKSASFGAKDDLKRISGVGPMLEGLLNQHGVYYFWQVADWTPSDIDVMDARLDVFKGRIERDDWVKQATQLSAESGTANKPSE
ncbi:MAG: hypothetical protein AB8B86_14010 [Pseudomonadales bacterium]